MNDLATLQGAWTLTSLEMDGRAMPAGGGIEIEGDRFRAVAMGADYAGAIELDEAQTPKQFDLVFREGPEAGNRNLGIYQLDADTWKLCPNITGKTRPKTFAATPGSGNAVEIFTRGAVTEAPDSYREAAISSAADGDITGEWEMVAAFQEGYALDPSMVKTARRVTTASETTTYFGKRVFMKATYTIDTSKKTIDLLNTAGPKAGATQLGIYEVGGDMMKICFTGPGQERPSSFESKAGDGPTSAIWKRIKR